MYNYKEQRETIFKDDGVPRLMIARDKVHKMLKLSGAFTMGFIISGMLGDSWENMACIDYLVELKEIKEIDQKGEIAGQNRIFVADSSSNP